MPSLDVVCAADPAEVARAVTNTARNLGLRLDFQGTSAAIRMEDGTITLEGDNAQQLADIEDVLRHKLGKRGVDDRLLAMGSILPASGARVQQHATLRSGLTPDECHRIMQLLLDGDNHLQTEIKGNQVHLSSSSREALQQAVRRLREQLPALPLSFGNYEA